MTHHRDRYSQMTGLCKCRDPW